MDHTDGFHIQFLNRSVVSIEIHSGSQVETAGRSRQPKGPDAARDAAGRLLSGRGTPRAHGADGLDPARARWRPSDCSFSELRPPVGQKSEKRLLYLHDVHGRGRRRRAVQQVAGSAARQRHHSTIRRSEKKEVEKLGNKLSYYKWMAKAVLGENAEIRPHGRGGGAAAAGRMRWSFFRRRIRGVVAFHHARVGSGGAHGVGAFGSGGSGIWAKRSWRPRASESERKHWRAIASTLIPERRKLEVEEAGELVLVRLNGGPTVVSPTPFKSESRGQRLPDVRRLRGLRR